MQHLTQLLQTFSPITLSEMDEKKLMDRTDTKYIFSLSKLPFLIEQLNTEYRVLDVKGVRLSRYESLYFDTEDFELFYNHQRGKSNRHKIRFRRYVESDLIFFEIKYKNNKGRTIKNRVQQDLVETEIQNSAAIFLHKHTPIQSSTLLPQFWANYSRITLVNNNLPERVTLDLNLHFLKDNNMSNFNDLVIAEVKQENTTPSTFLKLMKKYHLRTSSVSKYCLGVIQYNNNIKHNNFKSNLRNINKILYGTSTNNK